MKTFLLAILTFSSIQVYATSQSPGEQLASQVRMEKDIEKNIENALKKEVDVKDLSGFSVIWKTLKCTPVIASELSGQSGGVCTVTAVAWQVSSQVGIIKGVNKTTVAIIYADLE